MKLHVRLLTILPLLVLASCASQEQRSVRLLDQRLQTGLAPDIAANRAVVQSLSDGARVTLVDSSIFPNDTDALDNRAFDLGASVIQSLLDPDLMRIEVADTSTLPDAQRDARVRRVVQYFTVYGLAPSLRAAEPIPAGSAATTPAGLAITIAVVCSHRHGGFGHVDIHDGDGGRSPDCD